MRWLFKKCLGSLLVFLSTPALISLCTSCAVKDDVINIDGSSSMYTLFQNFSHQYPNADLSVRTNGSTAGVDAVLGDKVDFGNISRESAYYRTDQIFERDVRTYKQLWKSMNVKTITVGLDPIFVVYKRINNDVLTLNEDNVINLYRLFSGLGTFTYRTFGGTSDEPIYAFARIGGAASSGTAGAFLENNPLIKWKTWINKHPNDKPVYDILTSGSYCDKGHVESTNEPNVQVWTQMSNSNKSAVIGYLSAGFVYANWNVIKEEFAIMRYAPPGDKIIVPSDYVNNHSDLLKDGYGWYRQFNSLISLPKFPDPVPDDIYTKLTIRQKVLLTFAYFIATGKLVSDQYPSGNECKWYNDVLTKSGVIPVEDKSGMFKDGTEDFAHFLYSDDSLSKPSNSNSALSNKTLFA